MGGGLSEGATLEAMLPRKVLRAVGLANGRMYPPTEVATRIPLFVANRLKQGQTGANEAKREQSFWVQVAK